MKKLKLGQIIKIDWVDQSYYSGPERLPDVTQVAYGSSVGWFLEENKNWLTIASERFTTDMIAYRHITTFPKRCIDKIEIIRNL